IVGFPGETAEEFRAGYEFCREMGFARIHVFPYSPRPGTAAAGMPGRLPATEMAKRRRMMLDLAEDASHRFRAGFCGVVRPVLWEKNSGGGTSGLTDNYIRAYAGQGSVISGTISPVRLESQYRDGMWVERVD
ncbi:tRNA (N(6)-L-threonylcarbamoyladenosine(37)-C(2))-methylthiotransferase MtaB, partial [Chloroflexota bacterium]